MVLKPYRINFYLICFSGFWKVHGAWHRPYLLYQALIIVGFLILLFSELVALYHVAGITAFNDVMCTTSAGWLILLKAAFLLPRADQMTRIQDKFDTGFKIPGIVFGRQNKAFLKRAAKKVQNLTYLTVASMSLTAIMWALFPFIDGTRKLPLPFWPENLKSYPIYEILYVYQVVIICSACFCLASTDAMFCSFLIQTEAHFDILLRKMARLGSRLCTYPSGSHSVEALSLCIRHHQAIISVVKELEEIYRGPILVQLWGGTVLVCVAGLEVFVLATSVSTLILSRLFYMLIALADIYLYCFEADMVIQKSEAVALAAYNLPWGQLNWRYQYAVQTIIAQARRPPRITAGRLTTLSLATYLSVLKTAYNIFALLRQSASKN